MMIKNSVVLVLVFLAVACSKSVQRSNDEEIKDTVRAFKVIEIPMEYDHIEGIGQVKGYVPTADIAVQIAELILFPIYKKESIIEQRPYHVFLKNNSIWCIEGNLSDNREGGVFYIEIRKSDGAVLKVLHTK
ncbi:YbbC/YhhH family protein [Myroides odoratus]|uniref:YbbC/YhhH family protein n=1 Tax=Myroides odoratus TaxID=256 RepID=UPI00334269E9